MAGNRSSAPVIAYGVQLSGTTVRSNYPVRSKYLAAVLAMLLGIAGVHYFYLRNIVRGLIQVAFTALIIFISRLIGTNWLICIPFGLCVLRGVLYLAVPESRFCKANHVRYV